MKVSSRAALLALAFCGALLAVASAASQHNVPGHPHSHPHKAGTAFTSLNRNRRLGRGLLTEQSTSKADSSSPTFESAKAVKATNAVQKVLQWGWNGWGHGDHDSHGYGGWGGAVSYPPPGAPVYYPPSYAPHGDHYDYIPGHYHNGRKLMATSEEERAKAPMVQRPAPTPAAKPDTTVPATPEAEKSAQPAKSAVGKPGKQSAPTRQPESAQKAESTQKQNHGGWGGHHSGHYDYHAPAYQPHGNHYDYVPGHYHYHEGNHGWGKRL